MVADLNFFLDKRSSTFYLNIDVITNKKFKNKTWYSAARLNISLKNVDWLESLKKYSKPKLKTTIKYMYKPKKINQKKSFLLLLKPD